MSSTIRDFVNRLEETDIVPRDELQRLVERQFQGHWDSEPTRLADELVRSGRMSPFQADRLRENQPLLIDDYVLIEERGAGGMGFVYKARHRRMGRVVALKLIREEQVASQQAVKRFSREIKAIAALDHPNIVRAYDAGEVDGIQYLAMEYVEGEDLFRHVHRDGPLPVADAVDSVIQAAEGLGYAHDRGIIHRDVKPSNLMRDPSGRIRLLDLGLARLCLPVELDPEDVTDAATEVGDLLGTAAYMAPEQSQNPHEVDRRCDIYALGCTLHYLLTGSPVYGGSSYVDKVVAHRTAEIPPLTSPHGEIPARLQSAFTKMIAKDPDDRFQTMAATAAALRESLGVGEQEQSSNVSERQPTPDGPRRRAGAWISAAALLGLGVFILSQFRDDDAQDDSPPTESPSSVTADDSDPSSRDPSVAPVVETTPQDVAHAVIALGGDMDLLLGNVPRIGVASLEDVPEVAFSIRRVSVARTQADNAVMKLLGQVPELDRIDLAETSVTSEGVLALAGCQALRTLYMQNTDVDDSCVSALVGLPLLSELDLRGTRIGDRGLEELAQCSSLTNLRLGEGQPVSNDGLRHIAKLTGLTSLELRRTPADDELISELSSLHELEWLNLSMTRVSGASSRQLSSLPHLSHLFLDGTQFTSEEIDSLREMRPDCVISP